MTGILIQVKRRKAKGSVIRYRIKKMALGFFPAPADSTEDTCPYVTVVAEVGAQLPISPGAITDKLTGSALDLPTIETPRKPTAVKPPATATPATLPDIASERCASSLQHFRLWLFRYGVQCHQPFRQVCLQIPPGES
jgi:hypothetical protein